MEKGLTRRSAMPCLISVAAILMLLNQADAFVSPTQQYPISASSLAIFSTSSPFRPHPLSYSLVNPLFPTRDTSAKEESNQRLSSAQQKQQKSLSKKKSSATTSVPFVIQRLSRHPSDDVYQEISQMCINAFFNDGGSANSKRQRVVSFWKEWQLGYLRALQRSDLRARRGRYPDSNMMFIARQVSPIAGNDWTVLQKSPLVLDLDKVFNLKQKAAGVEYVEGEVLGFVEVTLRPYGLGEERIPLEQLPLQAAIPKYSRRPVLTNLSVKYEARNAGVGSRLMELCEAAVSQAWAQKEIILEVEDDNRHALQFYKKRGYQELYEDPSGRRYDTNGFFLRQLRCCRKVMRKDLRTHGIQSMLTAAGARDKRTSSTNGEESNLAASAAKALQRLRESFFSLG